MNTYCIQVRGQVDVSELNEMSPHQLTALRVEAAVTLFNIHTDQSGMIGLLRHLNNLGIVILAVEMQPQNLSIVTKRNEE